MNKKPGMKTLIALGIVALYAAAIFFIRHNDPVPQVDPRSFVCDSTGPLSCDGMRPR